MQTAIVIARRWNVYSVKISTLQPSSPEFRFAWGVGMSYEDIRRAISDRFLPASAVNYIHDSVKSLCSDYVLPPPRPGLTVNFRICPADLYCQRLTFTGLDLSDKLTSLEFPLTATVADLRREITRRKSGRFSFWQGKAKLFDHEEGRLSDCPIRPEPVEIRFETMKLSQVVPVTQAPLVKPPTVAVTQRSQPAPVGTGSTAVSVSKGPPAVSVSQGAPAVSVSKESPAVTVSKGPPTVRVTGPSDGCVDCTLVLPDGECHDIRVKTVAEAYRAGLAKFSAKPGQKYGIFSFTDILLEDDFEVHKLPVPRDLFLNEVLEVAINDRRTGKSIGTWKFPFGTPTSDIETKTARTCPGSRLSTRFGAVLDSRLSISRLDPIDFPLFIVGRNSVRKICVRDVDGHEDTFDFDCDLKITNLKEFLDVKRHLPTNFQLLDKLGSEPANDAILKTTDCEFLWLVPLASSNAPAVEGGHRVSTDKTFHTSTKTIAPAAATPDSLDAARRLSSRTPSASSVSESPRIPTSPQRSVADPVLPEDLVGAVVKVNLPPAVSAPKGPKAVYRFRRDEVVTEVEVGDDQTVGDAKDLYGAKINVSPELISFLLRGKVLKDILILSRQRIGSDQEIVVYVRELKEFILRSSPGIRPPIAERPLDYESQLDRLVAASGSDRTTCSRCFTGHDYDFHAALASLQELARDGN
jgi:hypothetical protein